MFEDVGDLASVPAGQVEVGVHKVSSTDNDVVDGGPSPCICHRPSGTAENYPVRVSYSRAVWHTAVRRVMPKDVSSVNRIHIVERIVRTDVAGRAQKLDIGTRPRSNLDRRGPMPIALTSTPSCRHVRVGQTSQHFSALEGWLNVVQGDAGRVVRAV